MMALVPLEEETAKTVFFLQTHTPSALTRTSLAGTLISEVQLPELRNKLLLFRSLLLYGMLSPQSEQTKAHLCECLFT